MKVVPYNKKMYESIRNDVLIDKDFKSALGYTYKNKPYIDRDLYTLYEYPMYYEVFFDEEDLKEICEMVNLITHSVINSSYSTSTINTYLNKKLNTEDTNHKYSCIAYCNQTGGRLIDGIIVLNKDLAKKVTKLTPKEERIQRQNEDRVRNINIINNFIIPSLSEEVKKYGLVLNNYLSGDKKQSFAGICFENNETFKKFIAEAILEKLDDLWKKYKLKPTIHKFKGNATFRDSYLSLYDGELTLDDDVENKE